jgi:hypothetical protein
MGEVAVMVADGVTRYPGVFLPALFVLVRTCDMLAPTIPVMPGIKQPGPCGGAACAWLTWQGCLFSRRSTVASPFFFCIAGSQCPILCYHFGLAV